MRDDYLHALFSPQAIAVVGSFDSAGALARVVLSNLEGWGYQGRIVPVNWTSEKDPHILDDLKGIDLAVVCLAPECVLEALEQVADMGVKAVIITSAGFREIGGQGYYLEESIIQLAERRNLTLLGPNCLGVASWADHLNASLIARLPSQGNIAFFSPSGSMCNAILDWAASEEIGFSKFASLGNRAVIDEASMLQFLAEDPQTSVIIGYLEGMNNGRRFARISQTITHEKPVIMLQAGMTEHGQKAISSHVGALTGSERAYQTALKQAGIIQVDNLSSLFDLARMFGTQPLPKGPNLAIVTNSGGAGILAADGMAGTSLILPRLGRDTAARLVDLLPRHAQTSNLVDIGMDATPVQYAQALDTVLKDRQIQMTLLVIAPGLGVDLPAIVRELVNLPKAEGKAVAVCLIGQEGVMEEKRFLQRHGLPCYSNPKAALASFEAMLRYAGWKTKSYPVEVCYRRDKAKAERFLQDCLDTRKTELFGFEVQPLLMAYELGFPPHGACPDQQERGQDRQAAGLLRGAEDLISAYRIQKRCGWSGGQSADFRSGAPGLCAIDLARAVSAQRSFYIRLSGPGNDSRQTGGGLYSGPARSEIRPADPLRAIGEPGGHLSGVFDASCAFIAGGRSRDDAGAQGFFFAQAGARARCAGLEGS